MITFIVEEHHICSIWYR